MGSVDPRLERAAVALLEQSLAQSAAAGLDPVIRDIAQVWSAFVPRADAMEAARNLIATLSIEDHPASVAAVYVIETRMRSGRWCQLPADAVQAMALAAARAWARSRAVSP